MRTSIVVYVLFHNKTAYGIDRECRLEENNYMSTVSKKRDFNTLAKEYARVP